MSKEYCLEICIDSVESAVTAHRGGANRVELCSALNEGGLTPAVGMLVAIKKHVPNLPVYVMIRPRGGDFHYSRFELEVMATDIRLLKDYGADGFVFGILDTDGTVAVAACKELLSLTAPLPCTFHRAIDMSRDLLEAAETIISLGFQRILTSGGESTVLEGAPLIRTLENKFGQQIAIMAGGGITVGNLKRILTETNVCEYHCTARTSMPSQMTFQNNRVSMGASYSPPEYQLKYADDSVIKKMIAIGKELE